MGSSLAGWQHHLAFSRFRHSQGGTGVSLPHLEIVNALRAQLSWTHLRSLIELLGQQDDSDE